MIFSGVILKENTILLIRCDKGGNCGELVWLQKGQSVSGTDALAIENAISSALDLRWVYLHDDSKIKYGGNTSRSQANLYLKTIRSIAKGQSWYSQAFYRPFNCKGWPSQTNIHQTGVEPGTVFTQNANEYKKAVKLIRKTEIAHLRRYVICFLFLIGCGSGIEIYVDFECPNYGRNGLRLKFIFLCLHRIW